MDVQLKRGMTDVCALCALLDGDSYGYKIIKEMSYFMPVSESTLYPILRRLESSGALTAYSGEHNGRLRKYYRITDYGRERIREFLVEWKQVMDIYGYIERKVKQV